MTYSIGGLIQAADYNSFAGPTASGGTANANLNDIWGAGSGDKGWGQTALGTVSTSSTVSATNWASLVNTLATAGTQTGQSLTSRTAPTAGQTVAIFIALNADLSTVTTNRGSAASVGTEYGTFSGSVAKTTGTGTSPSAWTITWTQTVTFPSADQARYFWNAGGRVRLQYSKTSTGTDIDPDWNAFVAKVGSIYLSGYVNGQAQTIAGQSYTGTTRIGGTGGTQTTLATTTGWYQLTTSPTTIFTLYNDAYLYTGEYIQTTATATSSTVLTLTTTWYQPAVSAHPGEPTTISGGSDTGSGSTTITGTAPTTLCTYIPPSATYLTNTWGTPSIASSVA
jgi:hypothetical protein